MDEEMKQAEIDAEAVAAAAHTPEEKGEPVVVTRRRRGGRRRPSEARQGPQNGDEYELEVPVGEASATAEAVGTSALNNGGATMASPASPSRRSGRSCRSGGRARSRGVPAAETGVDRAPSPAELTDFVGRTTESTSALASPGLATPSGSTVATLPPGFSRPRRRRGRGRGDGGIVTPRPSAAGATAGEPPQPPSAESTRLGPPTSPREALPAAPAASGLSSLEAVLARQNALMETMAAQQLASLQALQQSLAILERRTSGNGGQALTVLPRVAIFVDVPNVMYAADRLGVTIDFGKLRDFLARGRDLVRASAYAPISDDPQLRLETQRFVQPFVAHHYRIVTKPLKRFADGSMKANFDVELAIDVLTMSDRLDIVSLVSGDGDFRRLVELVQSKGVRVEVVAFAASTSAELRALADHYVDLTLHLNELAVR